MFYTCSVCVASNTVVIRNHPLCTSVLNVCPRPTALLCHSNKNESREGAKVTRGEAFCWFRGRGAGWKYFWCIASFSHFFTLLGLLQDHLWMTIELLPILTNFKLEVLCLVGNTYQVPAFLSKLMQWICPHPTFQSKSQALWQIKANLCTCDKWCKWMLVFSLMDLDAWWLTWHFLCKSTNLVVFIWKGTCAGQIGSMHLKL